MSNQPIKLLDGNYWKVFLNPNQQNLGQSLVILKADKSSLAELSPQEWEEFGGIVGALEKAIANELGPTHFNWQCLMNNAYEPDAEEVPHVHWHVSPRYDRPVVLGEYEFIDKNYPRTNKEANFVQRAVLEQIASKILTRLTSE